jgi:hypothetical protein
VAPKVATPIVPTLPAHVPPAQGPGLSAVGPPSVTYYFPIALGGSTPGHPVTGVFLPNGFTYPNKVDVILYFHGNRAGGPNSWKFDTVDQYWGGSYPRGEPPVLLRENLNKSGKRSVLLIAPTVGPYPGSGRGDQLGIFDTQAANAPGGFLEQVLTALAAKEPKMTGAKVGKIILGGHSGGGDPVMRQIELIKNTKKICEAWLFDAIYLATDRWVSAIEDNPDTSFYFHFGTAPQKKRAQAILDMYTEDEQTWKSETMYGEFDDHRWKNQFTENASVIENPKAETDDHFGALTKNFLTRLSAATCIS